MQKRGLLHSAVPGAEAWSLGIASVDEIEVVRQALQPVGQKILKSHLLAIEDDPDNKERALLKLRAVSDGGVSYYPIPRGSVIVNCTESLGKADQNKFEP